MNLPLRDRILTALPLPAGEKILPLLPVLHKALEGKSDCAYLPHAYENDEIATTMSVDEPIDDECAFVLTTSGSTASPKGALLSSRALRASIIATSRRLREISQSQSIQPDSWLLALPAWHIAGLMVILRAIHSGTEPIVLDVSQGFDPTELVHAVSRMPSANRYISLVPHQLVKALHFPHAQEALAEFDAVLIGGGALNPDVRLRAEEKGIRVVTTYGMSETCGGCVYDQRPLENVSVEVDESGRVHLAGPMLAHGYRGDPDHPAFSRPGWFATSDSGTWHSGLLRIQGRLDGGISSGGLTIDPDVVAAALLEHPLVAECAVVGIADPVLGERVAALIVAAGAEPSLEVLREHVAHRVHPHAAPRSLLTVKEIPRSGLGKIDRSACRALFHHELLG